MNKIYFGLVVLFIFPFITFAESYDFQKVRTLVKIRLGGDLIFFILLPITLFLLMFIYKKYKNLSSGDVQKNNLRKKKRVLVILTLMFLIFGLSLFIFTRTLGIGSLPCSREKSCIFYPTALESIKFLLFKN